MKKFSLFLTHLQAAIAARAARDRALTVLLVALWGRLARMRTRMERLIALWRAGKLPAPLPSRAKRARDHAVGTPQKIRFPTAPGWLRRKLGYDVAAFGSQLHHLLTEDECAAFLTACPQAARILRPLLRMLTAAPLPNLVRRSKPTMPALAEMADMVGQTVPPAPQFLDA